MFRKYPSVILLALVIAGIVTADQLYLPGWILLLSCLILTIVGIVFLAKSAVQRALLFFSLALFCFSGYHFSINFYEFGPNHISRLISEKEKFQIFGKITDWPDLKTNRTEIKIAIDSLGRDNREPVKGAILLKITDTTTALQRGDRVEFQATIYPLKSRTDPGGFDYARYLKLRGVFGTVYLSTLLNVRVDKSRRGGIIGTVDQIRFELTESFNRTLSPVSAALASGILIGETRNIPGGIYNRFRDSGTLHLLAVSGSNVALVILFIILILRPFSIKRSHRSVILIMVVFLFSLLSYGEPSVVRASLMAVLVLLATLVERRFDLNQIIATAALIILLVDPAQLFSVGFQLSFVTAWGLIFIVPKIIDRFPEHRNKKWFQWLIVPFIVSVVAQVCSMPLIAFYFDRVPAISVIANIIIVPLVSIAVVGSLFLFVVDLIWSLLGAFVGSVLDGFFRIVIYFLDLFGGENSPIVTTGEMSGLIVFLIYVSIVFTTLAHLNKMSRRFAVIVLIILVNIGLTFPVVKATAGLDSRSQLKIFNIPGGTAILVQYSPSEIPDLIISGLSSREYPIDERIFESSFLALGVGRIHNLFIMSSEYGAMDDILRMAEKFDVEDIYLDSRLSKSFSDIIRQTADSIEVEFKTFPAKIAHKESPGIFPAANYLTVRFNNSRVVVINDAFNDDNLHNPETLPSALIFCAPRINIDEISDMQNFSHIVCTYNIQHISSTHSTDSPKRIYSIDTQGPCRLIIPAVESDSFSVERIR